MVEKLMQVKVADIVPSPENPRIVNTKSEGFAELLGSITEVGVKVPLVVRPHPSQAGKFDLRCGQRRHTAAKMAKLEMVPAIVCEEMTDEQAFELTFLENFAREDLSPLEEAAAAAILMEKFGGDVRAVAAKCGHSEKWVRMRANIQKNLSKKWVREISKGPEGKLSTFGIGHYQLIARLPKDRQDKYLKDIDEWHTRNLSIADLEEEIDEMTRLLSAAPWKLDDERMKPHCCNDCKKRSGYQPGLWDNESRVGGKDEKCLDRVCWEAKRESFIELQIAEHKKKHPDLICVSGSASSYRQKYEARKQHNALDSDHYKAARKTEKGAEPAVTVCGRGLGKLKWVKLEDHISKTGEPKKTVGVKKTLVQRRDELKRKRWHCILGRACEQIKKMEYSQITHADKVVALMAMVIEYGVNVRWCETRMASAMSIMEKVGAPDAPFLLENLWELLKGPICSDLRWNDAVSKTSDIYIKKAQAATRIFGMDKDKLWAAAREEYKEPKGWAKEAEAAAVKKSPKKKGKKNKGEIVSKQTETKTDKERRCRVCGCTDIDRRQCIAAQGYPCHWVEADLCSRHANESEVENGK